MAVDYATVFAKKVSERFYRESFVARFLDTGYSFTGAKTVAVYHVPTVQMVDYDRAGANDSTSAFHRYGVPANLEAQKQELTITKDRGFTYIIDRADREQSALVLDAGKALARQIREVVTPEIDKHIFTRVKEAATAAGNNDATAITKDNAYSAVLDAQEALGNANVPDGSRLLYCTYGFAGKLKQSGDFIKDSDLGQKAIWSGQIGEVDGAHIFCVPSARLPTGCDFIMLSANDVIAPMQLRNYKIHDNPPGINGWLTEGRIVYDAFVLTERAVGMYYHGAA